MPQWTLLRRVAGRECECRAAGMLRFNLDVYLPTLDSSCYGVCSSRRFQD
jgi:hypothetical protein